jgi:hypothetical protein
MLEQKQKNIKKKKTDLGNCLGLKKKKNPIISTE